MTMALRPLAAAVAMLPAMAQCVPTPSGLVGWWSLENGGQDRTGTNHAAVFGTGGLFQPAMVGNGFRSSGPSNGFSAPDHPSLDVTTLTLEAWVRLDSIGAHNHTIIGRVPAIASSITTIPYSLGAVSNAGFGTNPGASVTGSPAPGKLWLIVTDGVLEQVLFSPSPLTLGAFHHVAATLDGTTARLFIDGQVVTTALQARTPFNSNDPLWIAGINNGFNTWPGLVDEVAIYNRALSAAEILSIYNAGANGKCAPTPTGNGCTGSGGVNVLAANTLPRIGTTYLASATGLAAPSLAVEILGFAALGLPLSVVLPQSAFGCYLLVSPDSLTATLSTNGTLSTSLLVPNVTSLMGLNFWQQVGALEFDSLGNLVSATTTNALALTIGS